MPHHKIGDPYGRAFGAESHTNRLIRTAAGTTMFRNVVSGRRIGAGAYYASDRLFAYTCDSDAANQQFRIF